MSLHTRTASAFAWNHISRTGEFILVYATSVILARALGAETYGAYSIFVSAVQLLIVVSSYGLEASIVSNFPRGGEPGRVGARPVTRLLLIRIVGIAIVAVICIILGSFAGGVDRLPPVLLQYLTVLLILFFFRNLTSFFSAILISDLNTARVAFITLSARCLEFAGILLLLSMGKGLHEVFLLVTVIAGVQLLAFLPRSGVISQRGRIRERESSRILRMGRKFWINGLMEFILGRQADVILLGLFVVGQGSIGRYDASVGLAQGINAGMSAGFMGVATASFAALGGRDKVALQSYWEHLSRLVLFLVVPLLILCIVAADVLIPSLYSADFISGVVFFRVFATSLIITRMLGGGLAANLLSAQGRADLILRSGIVSGATNLILALLLIPELGGMGAVIATSASAIVIAAMHARYAYAVSEVVFPWRFGLAVSAISLVSAFTAAALTVLLPWTGTIGLLSGFVVAFVILLYIVKPFSAADYEHLNQANTALASLVRPFSRSAGGVSHSRQVPGELTDRQKWAFINVPAGGVVADVGASDSRLCQFLESDSRVAIAIDIDLHSLLGVRLHDHSALLVNASASDIPIRSESVDTVLCLDVLEHVTSEIEAIREIHRILRPGGILLLSVPHSGLFEFLDPQNLSAWIRGKKDSVPRHRHYSLHSLERVLQGRFSIRTVRYGSLFLYPMTFAGANFLNKHLRIDAARLLRALGDFDNDISWGRLSYNLMIQAVKA